MALLVAFTTAWAHAQPTPQEKPSPAPQQEVPPPSDPQVSLTHKGRTLNQWIEELSQEDPYRYEAAIEALEQIGEPAVPAVVDALQSRDVRVRRGAAQVLGKMGAVTPDVIPALQTALTDADAQVQANATRALTIIGIRPQVSAEEEFRPRSEQLRQLWQLPEERQLSNLPRFGEELFVQAGVEAAQPAPNVPVPPGYLLGPGDEIDIRCWGEGIEHLNTTVIVSAEGTIYLPLLGEISITGKSLSTIRSLLTQQLQAFYANSQVSVTVATTRVVTVFVTGDVKRPGRYELDGTATVLTALYAAGGPTGSGSLRNIRWISRNRPVTKVDLYPYLLHGEPLSDQPLRPGDTIFVGPIGPEIGITGQVQRPARYELTGPISCAEAIQLSGGLSPLAYTQHIEIWRVADHQQQTVLSVNLQQPSSSPQTNGPDFAVQAGDVIVVPQVLPIPENAARISGAVRRPGIYQVEEGMKVSDLIQQAQGLDEGAYLTQAVIRRLDAHQQYQYLSFSVEDALARSHATPPIQPYDEVRIFYREEITPFTYVEVTGPVQNPDRYQWAQQMTVRDLIAEAGGVTEEAYLLEARLLRLEPDGNRRLLKVKLAEALQGASAANLTLQAGDILEISTQQEAVAPRQVHIDGFVQRPDSYEYYQGMKVSDLILAAGGLCPGAAHTAEYTSGRQTGKPKVQQLELAWKQENQVTAEPDLTLKPDDQITVLGMGDFRSRAEVVTVRGQVAHPGAYILRSTTEESETVYDLLRRAGPLLPDANPDGIIVYRPRERAMPDSQRENIQQIMRMYNRERTEAVVAEDEWQQTVAGEQAIAQAAQILTREGATTVAFPPRYLSLAQWITGIPVQGQKLLASEGHKGDVPLRDGDAILVPRRKSTVAVLGAVVRPGSVLFQPRQKLAYYITQAGGLTEDAAIKRTVVIRANSATYLASNIKQIKAGDIILVPSEYMVRTIHTESGFERILRALGAVVGAFLIAG